MPSWDWLSGNSGVIVGRRASRHTRDVCEVYAIADGSTEYFQVRDVAGSLSLLLVRDQKTNLDKSRRIKKIKMI